MKTPSQRGRTIRARSNTGTLHIFYIVLALVVVAGGAVITSATPSRSQAVPAGVAGNATFVGNNLPAKGHPDAPVTVIEYSDFQCPGCGAFATQMEAQFERDYVDPAKVRLLYHDFPLPQHPNAIPAAEAARCAADQNAFWQMHEMLFFNQPEWVEQTQPLDRFLGYADEIKINRTTFQQCLTSHAHRAKVLQAQREADQAGIRQTPTKVLQAQREADQAGIRQTPTFVIDGRQYTAPDLITAVDAALAAKK